MIDTIKLHRKHLKRRHEAVISHTLNMAMIQENHQVWRMARGSNGFKDLPYGPIVEGLFKS